MAKEIKYKGHTIVRSIAVINMGNGEIIDWLSDLNEYRRIYKDTNTSFMYAAAEVINKRGDTNPAVFGSTLKEATDKLKKLLK